MTGDLRYVLRRVAVWLAIAGIIALGSVIGFDP